MAYQVGAISDSIGYQDGMNWYAYTSGDPVNRRDPTGLSSTTCSNDPGVCQPPIEEVHVYGSMSGSSWSCEGWVCQDFLRDIFRTQEGAQKGQTYNPSDPNYHSYTLHTAMCDLGENGCSVRMVMGFTERESVPFETNPNTGEPLTLAGGNPIMHYSGKNWSLNVTMDGHRYHPGQVLHIVTAERGVVYLNTYGTGTGPNPALNEFVGYTLFGKMHADVWTSVKAQQIGNYYSNLFGQ